MAMKSEGKKLFVSFSNTVNNSIIYCSYLKTTSDESKEEEEKGGYDSQRKYFISLIHF